MVLKSLLGSLGGDSTTEAETDAPSHRCRSCGEEYFADSETEIRECRACGGVRVELA